MSAGKRYDGGDVPILHGSLSLCLFITRCKRGGGGAGSGVQVSTHAKPSFPRRGTVAPKMPRQSPLVDASVPATEPRQQVVRAPRHPSHRGQGRHGCSRRRTCGGGPRRWPMRLAEPRQRQLQDRRRCTSRPRRRSRCSELCRRHASRRATRIGIACTVRWRRACSVCARGLTS